MTLRFHSLSWDTDPSLDGAVFYFDFRTDNQSVEIAVYTSRLNNLRTYPGENLVTGENREQYLKLSRQLFTSLSRYIEHQGKLLLEEEDITLADGRDLKVQEWETDYEGWQVEI